MYEMVTIPESHYMTLIILHIFNQPNILIAYQILEHKIIEHPNVSLLCLFLLIIHLPPKGINASHVQQLVCIDLPGIATRQSHEV